MFKNNINLDFEDGDIKVSVLIRKNYNLWVVNGVGYGLDKGIIPVELILSDKIIDELRKIDKL